MSRFKKPYDRTTEEEPGNNCTDIVGTIDESKSVTSWIVEVCHPVLRILTGVEHRCIVAVEHHTCRRHERDIPKLNISIWSRSRNKDADSPVIPSFPSGIEQHVVQKMPLANFFGMFLVNDFKLDQKTKNEGCSAHGERVPMGYYS